MAFPEFDDGKRKILFFTRGRGRGHAVPDIEIAREIESIAADTQVRLVSYGMGARTFEANQVPHIDVGLPDVNPINETIVIAGKLVAWLDPDLVVAHEEFPALPAAKIFGKPTVMITDWFSDPRTYAMSSLALADRVLFLDEEGIYAEPACVEGRVEYLGPLVREFHCMPEDQNRARAELDIPHDAFVVGVFPGSWREAEAPILDLMLEAFDALPDRPKRLLWMSGEDSDRIRSATVTREDVEIYDYHPNIDRFMVASDVAITKGTRNTLFELASLGKSSVSLVFGDNPIDRNRATLFPHNRVLGSGVAARDLIAAIEQARREHIDPVPRLNTPAKCARRLTVEAESAGF